MEEVVGYMEQDVKEILDKHEDTLKEHTEKIQELSVDSEVSKEKFNSITNQLNRIEATTLASNNSLLASNNSVLQTLNTVLESNNTKSNNHKEVAIKVLSILGACIAGFLAAKYGLNINL